LIVTDGDEKLTISFNKPEAAAVLDPNQGEPVIDGYQIYLYDMCMNGASLASGANIAHSRLSYSIPYTEANVSDPFSKEITGLPNGKAYVVAVHTIWRYGDNQASKFTTYGIYHTLPNPTSSTEAVANATQATSGAWTLPTLGIGSPSVTNCAIPRGTPLITYTLTPASLRFDSNGAPLLFGAMIQMAPTADSNGDATAFYLDMAGAGATNAGVSYAKVNGKSVYRSLTDICATTILGSDWATEKNFVMVQNEAGSAYVKINIA